MSIPPAPVPRPSGTAALRRRGLLGLAAGGLLPRHAAAEPLLPALIPDDVLRDYQRFLAGRDPAALGDYGGPQSRRDVVEVVLIHQALARQDRTLRLAMAPMPTSQRLQAELRIGHAACSATSYWREDFPEPDGLLFSDPVLLDGEFEAGLYTTPTNRRALAARQLRDVQQLRVLCNSTWRVDWHTLRALGIADLQHVASWNLMPRMLQQERADLLLAPFQPTPDLAMVVDGIRLVPVPGLKVAMRGTRHYLVSATHALGPRLCQQLNAGLAALRREGRLRRAYEQSGFFNAQVAGWTRL